LFLIQPQEKGISSLATVQTLAVMTSTLTFPPNNRVMAQAWAKGVRQGIPTSGMARSHFKTLYNGLNLR